MSRLVNLLVALLIGWAGLASLSAAETGKSSSTGYYNIRDYGAVGNGQTLDTPAINRAIEACAAAGGGQVLFPPGRFLSGTVQLRSGVVLRLEAGATLVGTTNLDQYHHFTPPAGTHEARFRSTWHRALVLGIGLTNVGICGEGVIDGNRVFDPRGEERMRGPHTILLGHSREITFRDFSIKDSANYAVMLEDCQEVEARDLRITGGWDGIHFRGWPDRLCRNIRIINCEFYTGDDSIAGRYWDNVLISGCIINSSCNGLRLIGPAKRLVINDCLFYGPGVHPHRTSNRYNMLAGLCLQPGAWDSTEGQLDEVVVSDVSMHNVTTPFHFSLKPGNTAGRITVSRVHATGVYRAAASVESWAETPFTNVVFRDVTIEYEGGGKADSQRPGVRAPGVDARGLPAWGFFARNVQDLTLDHVRVTALKDDFRPVLIAEKVGRLQLENFQYPRVPGAAEAFHFDQLSELRVRETDLTATEPRNLQAHAIPAQGNVVEARKPYAVRVEVENGSAPGILKLPLTVSGQTFTRWLWMQAGEKQTVTFENMPLLEAGNHELKVGNVKQTLRVE